MDMNIIIPKLIINVGILFIMMVPGVILKKCNMISDGFGKSISNLVLYIAQPALIFFGYVSCDDRNILRDSLVVLLLSLVAHLLFSIIAILAFMKAPDGKKRLLRLATIFSNAAFMGIPLVIAIYAGTPYVARATIFASIYNITFNLFLWSLGVFICTNKRDDNNDGVLDHRVIEKKKSVSPLTAIYHPVTVAAVLGIVALVFNFKENLSALFGDGAIISDSLVMLKGLVAPLSMIIVGIRLADINFKNFFNDFYMYISLALRHLVLPVAVIGAIVLLKWAGLPVTDEVFNVTVILAAAPSASSATMFAEKFDCDAGYISRVVTTSTIISIVTMPLVLFIGSAVLSAI